jgi:hypothetical protein
LSITSTNENSSLSKKNNKNSFEDQLNETIDELDQSLNINDLQLNYYLMLDNQDNACFITVIIQLLLDCKDLFSEVLLFFKF